MEERDIVIQNQKELVGLCKEAKRGGITRRQFVERALILGLSAGTVGALVGACGEEDAEPEAPQVEMPVMDETMPEEITVYNWTDYMDPEIRKQFKAETGIKVNETYFASNEELLAKLRAGSTGYDIIVPSDYMCQIMIMSELLQPLDIEGFIPNFAGVGETLKAPAFDDPANQGGMKYSVPYFYGTTGYATRTDKVSPTPTDWTPLFDEANSGKIQLLDDERECLGMGLKSLGFSVNTEDQAELDQATEKLIAQKPLVSTYDSVNMKRAIVQGIPYVMCWDGDVLMAIDALGGEDYQDMVDWVLPSEGFVRWTDAMSMPTSAASRYGGHLFMNYLLDPEIAGQNASWVWYLSAVPASRDFTDPFALILTPTDEDMARSEEIEDLGEFAAAYQMAWTKVKSA
ncbi:MAG: spermidine/putrescine ABC transporter substrate-binding protein [Actinomycetota bacterium]|nr:MAG: spermidine/putrescine ABC transporter substrate-binding protein [Actinomycetota bacterium]